MAAFEAVEIRVVLDKAITEKPKTSIKGYRVTIYMYLQFHLSPVGPLKIKVIEAVSTMS